MAPYVPPAPPPGALDGAIHGRAASHAGRPPVSLDSGPLRWSIYAPAARRGCARSCAPGGRDTSRGQGQSREENLSAQQHQPQADARLPRAHVHEGRRRGHQAPPQEGSQAPERPDGEEVATGHRGVRLPEERAAPEASPVRRRPQAGAATLHEALHRVRAEERGGGAATGRDRQPEGRGRGGAKSNPALGSGGVSHQPRLVSVGEGRGGHRQAAPCGRAGGRLVAEHAGGR